MNPYDRRAVRSVWARVMPGRDVFAPGAWPAPPPSGRGGLPPTPPRNPDDNKPPMPPQWQQPGQSGRPTPPNPGGQQPGHSGRPNSPNQGGWQRPGQGGRPAPPKQEEPSAGTRLLELAAGYDALARRLRSTGLRQMAAQCRRGQAALQNRCGVHGSYAGASDATLNFALQREREAALRRALEALPDTCAQLARQLIRESQIRSRQLSRMG